VCCCGGVCRVSLIKHVSVLQTERQSDGNIYHIDIELFIFIWFDNE
jgi:hypothetical protein